MRTAERTRTQPSVMGGPPGLGWRELLIWLAIGLSVTFIAGMVMIGEVIPPLVVFAALVLIGAFLARRGGRAGPIMLVIISVAVIALNAPFITLERYLTAYGPASTADFLLGTASTALALGVLIASIGTLRSKGASSRAPRALAMGISVALVALVGVAVVARVTYDQPLAASGDVTLVTENSEFAPEAISAASGEVTVFVENADNTLHTFTIEELGVDLQIPGKSTARVSFDAGAGAYEFVCKPHKDFGMTGTLDVE